jgi:hypothetical protein
MKFHRLAVCLFVSVLACFACGPSVSTTSGPSPSVDPSKPAPTNQLSGSSKPTSTNQPTSTANQPGAPAASAIEITAEALGEEYAKDSDAAQKKYQGKILRITANHLHVLYEMVYLATGKTFPTGQPVKISMRFPKEDDTKELADVEQIVVEGRVGSAGVFGPSLEEFKIVSKKMNEAKIALKTAVFKASDVTKAYKDDPAAAKKKYEAGGALTIEGVVKDVTTNDKGEVSVTLAGDDESVEIICNTFKNNEAVKNRVKKGQTIKVKGSWHVLSLGMLLAFAELLE